METTFKLENDDLVVTGITYGATLTSIMMKNANQLTENLLLNYSELEDYRKKNHMPYLNSVVGPLAGRVKNGRYKDVQLTVNQGVNHLHGGFAGFSFQNFKIESQTETKIIMSHYHIKGIDNYTGSYLVTVTYEIIENKLLMTFDVDCNPIGPINMTSHLYFNLNGNGKGNVLGHKLLLKSDAYYTVDSQHNINGDTRSTKGTCFDFNEEKTIGEQDCVKDESFSYTKGFDHPFLLTSNIIKLKEPSTKRTVTIETNQPVVVLYTGNFLDNRLSLNGRVGRPHMGVCLETQQVPNHVNILDDQEVYKTKYQSKTSYLFEVE